MSYQHQGSELDSLLQALGRQPSAAAPSSENAAPSLQLLQSLTNSGSHAVQPRDVQNATIEREADNPPQSGSGKSTSEGSATIDSEPEKPTVDPREIVAWKPALRHTTRLISRNTSIQERIRNLHRAQHDHERRWWKGREALIKQQAARGDGKKKLEALLKTVGGSVDTSIGGWSPEEEAKELQSYDTKVYHAFADMQKDYQKQLAGMGIPFFGTHPSLITDDLEHGGAKELDSMEAEKGPESGANNHITGAQLRVLQLKMVGLLEDLCAD